MAKFRKIELEIRKLSGYGNYIVSAKYRGKQIQAITHDSECYDWLEDESNKEKHKQAKRAAYSLIVSKFNNQ